MKNLQKFFLVLLSAGLILGCTKEPMQTSTENSSDPHLKGGKKTDCVNIQSGTITNSAGVVIKPGFDKWGYNYQAMIFVGKYCDAYQNAAWCQAYKDDVLSMKWNEAWLSNKDCDGDGKLDRHYGFSSYRGSGAWLTNHQSGFYEMDGKECKWTYFVKIVAAPLDATLVTGVWIAADGTEIGPAIWGEFAVIEEVWNDPCARVHGIQYLSPDHAGLGNW
jgi:hypothetical protein